MRGIHRGPMASPHKKPVTQPPFLAHCEENPSVTDGFPSQKASNTENISISWSYQDIFQWSHPFKHASIQCTPHNYSTGVQIVSCTLSSDSVFSDSTGLFNPVLWVSANEIAFDKKLANQSVSFNWYVRPGRTLFSPSTWWLQQAFLKA